MGKHFKNQKSFKNKGQGRHDNRKHYSGQKRGMFENEKSRGRPKTNISYDVKNNLKEEQVGITEYVSMGSGFKGIVKSRYSDFHVNEIDDSGKILYLNDLSIPQQKKDPEISAEEWTKIKSELEDVVTSEHWDQLKKLADSKAGEEDCIKIECSSLNKEQRTMFHKCMKQAHGNKLHCKTIDENEVSPNGKNQNKIEKNENEETSDNGSLPKKDAADKEESTLETKETNSKLKKYFYVTKALKGFRERSQWTFGGDYVYFTLYKENVDTSEIAATLANRLRLRPSQVNYCGNKDKRAKTTQKFCIKKRTPSEILSAVKHMHGVRVGNFEFGNEVLKLGYLKGNRFRIALRHLSGEREDIEKSLSNLRDKGFINYYGMQRFGNCAEVPTYEVGVALLKSDYKLACELILKPREHDMPMMRKARELWWKSRDAAAALLLCHHKKSIEKLLLEGLANAASHDYAGALRKIPRNMLLLYIHALQSLVYNRIVSRRIKEFGLNLIPGDLVLKNEDERLMDIDVETLTDENEDVEDIVSKPEETISKFKLMVKALTEEDIASGKYTIFDIVLPLPGYDITYPSNVIAEWYESILKEYDLTSEKLRHNVKSFAMGGAYRKLLIQPQEMSWKFVSYNKPDDNLIASDWEQLQQKNLPEVIENGSLKALVLDIILPSSAYATMCLREVLKSDTSSAAQTQLYKEAEKETQDLAKVKKIDEDLNVESVKNLVEQEKNSENLEIKESNDSKDSDEDIQVVGEKRKISNELEEDEANPTKILKVA